MADALRPWTITARRTILRDKWIDLTAETCLTAKGEVIDPFYLLKLRDWCCVMAVDADDHVILVRQYRHGIGATSLELPGGVVDAEDENPAAAALRELGEETGYVCDAPRAAGIFAPNPHNQTNRMHVFAATGARPAGVPSFDHDEALIVERYPLGTVGELIRSGAIVHGLHIAALTLGLTALGR